MSHQRPDRRARPGRYFAAALGCLWIAAGRAHAARESDAQIAERLQQGAVVEFRQVSADSRRIALEHFEEATRIAPQHSDWWLAYGQACIESGQFTRGRGCFERATRLGGGAKAWLALGDAWKRDWLLSLERSSLDEAARCFEQAGSAAPDSPVAWSAAAAVEILRGRTRDALASAQRARRADPAGAEPLMMVGAAFQRLGVLAWADSAFQAARERVSPVLAGWFDRFPGDAASEAASGQGWSGTDPDLTTPANEAQLDYWTRLALAAWLFREDDVIHWDKRAELFLRYGPPGSVDFNPAGAQIGARELEYLYPRRANLEYAPDPLPYPYNMQVWSYPELGMNVVLWDRSLAQNYELPVSESVERDPRPDPAMLAARSDLVAMGGGVFRTTPPGTRALDVTAMASRFPADRGGQLIAHVSAAGGPADTLWGSWALVSATGEVIAREGHALSVSACDPGAEKVADFAATVAPGTYRIDVAARTKDGRHGVVHLRAEVPPATEQLAISDLVLVCGSQAAIVERGAVRIEPNMGRRVAASHAVVLYYELDHLALRPDGTSRFTYECVVDRADTQRGSRSTTPAYHATREEENVGGHRRQFISIPAGVLPPGSYDVRVQVHDREGGGTVSASLGFIQEGR